MKIAIMQPYFLPYLGYFQLINAVDKFVIYDNIEYTKKGWINRNRILVNGKAEIISLPLKKGSDYLHVIERTLADSFDADKNKLLRKLHQAYCKAPYFESAFPLLLSVFASQEKNLFHFIHQSLMQVCNFLGIKTTFIISSALPGEHSLKAQDKVIAICKTLHATTYLNSSGGVNLYSADVFKKNNIELGFMQPDIVEYPQFKNKFVDNLSIVDVIMFNSAEDVKKYLQNSYNIN